MQCSKIDFSLSREVTFLVASLFYITFALEMKNNAYIQLITAALIVILGMVLLFCGLKADPEGEIHETVLVAFGEAATFAGSIMGIDYHYKHNNNDNTNPTTKSPDGQSGDGNPYPPLRGGNA